MYLPNYKNGSIVNLMSSIGNAYGVKTISKPLKILPPRELKKRKNVILIVIDGLGYDYLRSKGKETIFNDYLIGSMTSVIPATTASAITSFLTGNYPQQHAISGWYVYLKEIGMVCAILPFITREGRVSLKKYNVKNPALSTGRARVLDHYKNAFSFSGLKPQSLRKEHFCGIKIENILKEKSFSSKLNVKNFIIQPTDVAFSDYSRLMSKNAGVLAYRNLNGLFNQIKKAINSSNKKKYIYVYWPLLDKLNHLYGVYSKESEKHFKEIDKKFIEFIKYIKKTDSTLIITSDHGFINTPKERIIRLEEHPKLKRCLKVPLSGEPRLVYCYVYPEKRKEFEKYIKTKMKKYCRMYKSKDLIKKNFFGFGKFNPKLYDRVGDYVLIMKDNYVLKDRVKGDKKRIKKGYHGGVSRAEMLVPLVVVD